MKVELNRILSRPCETYCISAVTVFVTNLFTFVMNWTIEMSKVACQQMWEKSLWNRMTCAKRMIAHLSLNLFNWNFFLKSLWLKRVFISLQCSWSEPTKNKKQNLKKIENFFPCPFSHSFSHPSLPLVLLVGVPLKEQKDEIMWYKRCKDVERSQTFLLKHVTSCMYFYFLSEAERYLWKSCGSLSGTLLII